MLKKEYLLSLKIETLSGLTNKDLKMINQQYIKVNHDIKDRFGIN